jgi:hypothetical protein
MPAHARTDRRVLRALYAVVSAHQAGQPPTPGQLIALHALGMIDMVGATEAFTLTRAGEDLMLWGPDFAPSGPAPR